MRILVVDDSAVSRALIANLLRKTGYEVIPAGDGIEALERLGTEQVDLIVSDALMPKMDGFELCRRIKTSPLTQHIPFIFYSADYISPEDEQFARDIGANRYLVKSGDPGRFIQGLEDTLIEARRWVNREVTVLPPTPEEDYLRGHKDRLHHKLEEKVIHLERANHEILGNNRKLQRLDRVKQDFMLSLSARLRTPLTVVVGYAQMVLDGKAGPVSPEQSRFLDMVMQHAALLQQQIEELPDFDLAGSRRELLRPRATAFQDLLQSASDTIRHLLDEYRLYLEIPSPVPDIVLEVDPDVFQQVVVALLDNAVKFSPAGGTVTLEADASSEWAIVRVRDRGFGIPADRLPQIFDGGPSPRGQVVRHNGGIGLGLAAVKTLVELQGGRIWAESQEWRGSTFTVILPRSQRADLGTIAGALDNQ